MSRRALGAWMAILLGIAACTRAQLMGQSSVYPVLDALSAAPGVNATESGGTLASDVLTSVKKTIEGQQVCVPTVFEDPGRATFHLQLKDPGSAGLPTEPSSVNTVTFTRYHVRYVRADGRNLPGVDVPYEFDGGMTMSVAGRSAATGQFVIVRAQAKKESPLRALVGGGGRVWIAVNAEVTFYGRDQAGRAVSVTGYLDVTFSDWADPDC